MGQVDAELYFCWPRKRERRRLRKLQCSTRPLRLRKIRTLTACLGRGRLLGVLSVENSDRKAAAHEKVIATSFKCMQDAELNLIMEILWLRM